MTTMASSYHQPLLEALSNGPLRTGEIDVAVMGHLCLDTLITGKMAPYGDDLCQLIKCNKVVWRIADDGDIWYALPDKVKTSDHVWRDSP